MTEQKKQSRFDKLLAWYKEYKAAEPERLEKELNLLITKAKIAKEKKTIEKTKKDIRDLRTPPKPKRETKKESEPNHFFSSNKKKDNEWMENIAMKL